jgi:hypothetical protein
MGSGCADDSGSVSDSGFEMVQMILYWISLEVTLQSAEDLYSAACSIITKLPD